MKKNPLLKMFRPAAAIALPIVIACGLSVRSVEATPYVVTLQQVGPNVVATGTGQIDLTGLTFVGSAIGFGSITANPADISVGGPAAIDDYFGSISGPSNFGSSGVTYSPNSNTGSPVGLSPGTTLPIFVPSGYVSDSLLSPSSSTYNGRTFSGLGVTPGIYTWTWGSPGSSSRPDQSFTLDIIAPGVPDAGSTLGLLSLSLITLFGASRFRFA